MPNKAAAYHPLVKMAVEFSLWHNPVKRVLQPPTKPEVEVSIFGMVCSNICSDSAKAALAHTQEGGCAPPCPGERQVRHSLIWSSWLKCEG